MRKGINPQKNDAVTAVTYTHQVIVPVYIPHHENYFKESFKIFKLCLESVFKTVHSKTYITIVNNGSCKAVVDYLNQLYSNGEIHEVIHTTNIGKINAILKGISGHNFSLVTIADADVLFLNEWQNETVKVFNEFPKAGVVGIVPQFKLYADLCSNVLFDHFFSKKLAFTKVANPEAMKHFYKSIEWDDNYNQDFLKVNLTIEGSYGKRAIVGSGHFVATYRYSALEKRPTKSSHKKMGAILRSYFDEPVLRAGGWRLTTQDNYAYHMGNVYEAWMDFELKTLRVLDNVTILKEHKISNSKLSHFIKNHLFRKLTENKKFINWFIKFKGLPKEMTKSPWHE